MNKSIIEKEFNAIRQKWISKSFEQLQNIFENCFCIEDYYTYTGELDWFSLKLTINRIEKTDNMIMIEIYAEFKIHRNIILDLFKKHYLSYKTTYTINSDGSVVEGKVIEESNF